MVGQRNDDNVGTENQSQRGHPKANDIADEAKRIEDDPSEDSEKAGSNRNAVNPQDEQDLVDHMNQMVNSGRVDRSAFDGERNDDDEESELGSLDPAEKDGAGKRDAANYGNQG